MHLQEWPAVCTTMLVRSQVARNDAVSIEFVKTVGKHKSNSMLDKKNPITRETIMLISSPKTVSHS